MEQGSGGIIMTKWQEDDRSMGHVYPQEKEWERWRRVWRRWGDSRLKGHSVYGEKERLRDIDVQREERDEERQLGMERGPLALKRERVDEAKEGQKWWEPESGENSHGGKRGREERKDRERGWNPVRIFCPLCKGSSLMSWKDTGNMKDSVCGKHAIFLFRWGSLQGVKEETERHKWFISVLEGSSENRREMVEKLENKGSALSWEREMKRSDHQVQTKLHFGWDNNIYHIYIQRYLNNNLIYLGITIISTDIFNLVGNKKGLKTSHAF